VLEFQARLSDTEELRPVGSADLDELHAVVDANRDHLRPWMPWADQDRDATRQFIEAARIDAEAERGLQFVILADGRISGACGFHALDWRNRSVSIGYWLAAAAQRRGLITRGVTAMLDHAFGAWSMHRLELRAAPANTRSRAAAERLGFTEEGRLREAELVGGRHHDLIVYSMLASEWRRNRPA
jgi:ribosomal-protein-serine acetyltransferase